jgi:hypothetical protein
LVVDVQRQNPPPGNVSRIKRFPPFRTCSGPRNLIPGPERC